jgi:hypothetical protein
LVIAFGAYIVAIITLRGLLAAKTRTVPEPSA